MRASKIGCTNLPDGLEHIYKLIPVARFHYMAAITEPGTEQWENPNRKSTCLSKPARKLIRDGSRIEVTCW